MIISIAAAALLYLGATLASSYSEVWNGLRSLDLPTWVLVLSLPLANFLLRFVRWSWYLSSLGHSVPAARNLQIYLAGFALTTTPGKVGETVRSLFLVPHGVPYRDSMAAFVAERFTDLMAVAFLATLASFRFQGYGWFVTLSSVALVFLLWLLRSRYPSMLLSRVGARPGRFQKILSSAIRALESCKALLALRLLAGGLLLAVLAWAMEGVAFWVILDTLGLPVSPFTAIGVYAIGTLAGALSFIPGGIGAMEGVISVLLVLSGASLPVAVSATIVIRIAALWLAVALGGLAMASLARGGTPFRRIAS